MIERLEQFQNVIDGEKRIFEGYIKNKEYPLEDRWEIFIKAPDSLKEYQSWVIDLKGLTNNRTFSWYDDFYVERYQTKDLDADFIERVEEKFPEVDINSIKEQILENNLGSFRYDW